MRHFVMPFIAAMLLCSAASAHSSHAGDIAIGHAWGKPVIDKNADGTPYLTARVPLLNNGAGADTLTGIDANGASATQLIMGGTPVATVELPPGKPVPVMVQLQGIATITPKQNVFLTLHFAHAPVGHIDAHIEDKAAD